MYVLVLFCFYFFHLFSLSFIFLHLIVFSFVFLVFGVVLLSRLCYTLLNLFQSINGPSFLDSISHTVPGICFYMLASSILIFPFYSL